MDIISTVKPDVPKKPEVKIEYNNRSYESYMKNGFADAIPRSIQGPHDRMLKFLAQVDLRKGEIERTVRSIVRLRAPDFSSPSKKNERKEWVYYEEYWNANDWDRILRLHEFQYWPVDDLFNRPKAFKQSATKLEFKPSESCAYGSF